MDSIWWNENKEDSNWINQATKCITLTLNATENQLFEENITNTGQYTVMFGGIICCPNSVYPTHRTIGSTKQGRGGEGVGARAPICLQRESGGCGGRVWEGWQQHPTSKFLLQNVTLNIAKSCISKLLFYPPPSRLLLIQNHHHQQLSITNNYKLHKQ